MDRNAFSDLGPILFDECHLLHPREDDRSLHRLDAMLANLNFASVAPAVFVKGVVTLPSFQAARSAGPSMGTPPPALWGSASSLPWPLHPASGRSGFSRTEPCCVRCRVFPDTGGHRPEPAHCAAPGTQRERRLSPVSAPAMLRDQGPETALYVGARFRVAPAQGV